MSHDRIHHNFLKQENYRKKYFLLLVKYYTIIKRHEPNCHCVLVQFFFFMGSNFQSSHEPCKGISNHFLHQTFYNEAGVQGHMTDELIISSVSDTALKRSALCSVCHTETPGGGGGTEG